MLNLTSKCDTQQQLVLTIFLYFNSFCTLYLRLSVNITFVLSIYLFFITPTSVRSIEFRFLYCFPSLFVLHILCHSSNFSPLAPFLLFTPF
jgi:hypothetical protein